MKKNFYLCILALLPMCFAACGSDDEEGPGIGGATVHPSPTPSPTFFGLDGKNYKLLSIDSQYEFKYDTNGVLTSMKNSSSYYSVSESSFAYSNNSTGNNGYTVNVAMNDSGCVSKIAYEYVKGNHKENGVMSFTYDNIKQLVSIEGSVTANWVDEKQREGWKDITIKHSNEWVNGNLVGMKVVRIGKHKEETDAEESNYSKEETRSFSYGNEKNELRQMPYRISEKILYVPGADMLGLLGLLGVGPTNFPTSDGSGYKLNYYTNRNGTISNEILINDNYGGKGKTETYPHKYKYE